MAATKTVELQIRRATKYDVLNGKSLKVGLTYYVSSSKNPDTFCGPLKTAAYTNQQEFSTWYSQGRIYVPVGALDNNIRISNF